MGSLGFPLASGSRADFEKRRFLHPRATTARTVAARSRSNRRKRLWDAASRSTASSTTARDVGYVPRVLWVRTGKRLTGADPHPPEWTKALSIPERRSTTGS